MFGWESERSWPSLIIGVILVLWGLIPWLNKWSVIGFTLPGFFLSLTPNILLFILAGGGVWLLVDTFWGGEDDFWWWTTFVIGLIVLLAGIVQLLNVFSVIGFSFPLLTVEIYYILFVIEGIALFFAAFQQ